MTLQVPSSWWLSIKNLVGWEYSCRQVRPMPKASDPLSSDILQTQTSRIARTGSKAESPTFSVFRDYCSSLCPVIPTGSRTCLRSPIEQYFVFTMLQVSLVVEVKKQDQSQIPILSGSWATAIGSLIPVALGI